MWRSTELRVSPLCLPALLLALLWGAGEVLPLIGLAALCHELGHLFVLWCFTSRWSGSSSPPWGP